MSNYSTPHLSQLIYIFKMIIYSSFNTCALNYRKIMGLWRFNFFEISENFLWDISQKYLDPGPGTFFMFLDKEASPNSLNIHTHSLYHSSHISQTSLPPSIKIIHPTQISHCNKNIYQLS